MRSNYNRIGDYIRLVDERNKDLRVTTLLGLTIDKEFIPSVANTVGSNMKNYKIIRKDQFACSLMQVRRDKKIPVALLKDFDEAIISQAYPVFEIIDTNELLPDYLMMWMSRQEFDREACFYAVGGVRGSMEWEDFCNMKLPVPSIDKQRAIVEEYNIVVNRIKLNEQLNQKLEETIIALYNEYYKAWQGEKILHHGKLKDICSLITDGKHGDCLNEVNSGYYFISAKDIQNEEINYTNARQIRKEDFKETHRRTNFSVGDVLITNSGTIGRIAIGRDIPETSKTTFQKSVALLKPNEKYVTGYFLFCLIKSRISELIELASGTSQSNLLLGELRNFYIDYPEANYMAEFNRIITPIFEFQHKLVQENNKLVKLRQIILSKISQLQTEKEMV